MLTPRASDPVPANFDSVAPVAAFSLIAEEAQAPPPRALRLAAAAGAAVSVLVLLVAIVGREAAVAALPDLAPLYAAAALPVNAAGIEIVHVEARRGPGRDAPLELKVRLTNPSGRPRAVPPLLVELRDAKGRVLAALSRAAGPSSLDAGASVEIGLALPAAPGAVSLVARLGAGAGAAEAVR